jgi:hypothetical protein
MYNSNLPLVGVTARPIPCGKHAPKTRGNRRVCVLYETLQVTEHATYLFVPVAGNPSEAILLSRAANVFRDRYGYEDRIVGVDLYPL